MKGTLKSITQDLTTGLYIISFEVRELPQGKMDGELEITAHKFYEKRSHNANAYFHALTAKIAAATKTTLTHAKNLLIRDYGQYEYIDGMIPTITVKAEYENRMLDMESVHLKTIERSGDTVKMAFLRGSHTYNTAEMARLIDGTVDEAKALGIETLTPAELERMKSTWTGKN